MAMTNVGRLQWMDALKFLAIFLVCWGHSILYYGINKDDGYGIQPVLFIYSFHMPLFMTVSGYFSYGILDHRFNIKKKFVQLILPTITLGCLCLMLDIHSLNFWYLKSLFGCYLISALIFSLPCRGGIIFAFLFVSFFCFPLLNAIPFVASYKIDFMLPFFITGMLVRKHLNINAPVLIVSVAGFLFCLMFWNKYDIWYYSKSMWFDYKEMIVTGHFAFYRENLLVYLFRFVTGLLGSIAAISFFKMTNEVGIFRKIYAVIGRYGIYTLEIYLLQSFIIEINPLKMNFPTDSHLAYSYVYALPYSIFAVIVCILISRIIEKNSFFSFYVFGKQQTSKA